MRKIAVLTLLIIAVFSAAGIYSGNNTIYASPEIPAALDAETAILIDQLSGKVLYAKDADKQMYPASTTKVMTALIAVEQGSLDEKVTVGNEVMWVPWDSSKAGLSVGDEISLQELIYALMLPSGNDAAYTIAVHIGRQHAADPELSIGAALEVFAGLMNQRAQELGAKNTNFTVPDGYHDDDHYTTAHDLALIAREAMKHQLIREVAATGRYVPETWVGPHVRPWGNTNQLIRPYDFFYEYATGLKTGYTGQAGFCMVGSGAKDGMNLIAVVMKTSKDGRWLDSTALMEYGFENYAWLQLVEDNEVVQSISITRQDVDQPDLVELTAAQGFGGVFLREDIPRIEKTIRISEDLVQGHTGTSAAKAANNAEAITAPLTKGQMVGEMIFSLDGEELFRTELVAAADIAAMPWWRKALLPGALSLGLGLPAALAATLYMKKRRRRYIFKAAGKIGLTK